MSIASLPGARRASESELRETDAAAAVQTPSAGDSPIVVVPLPPNTLEAEAVSRYAIVGIFVILATAALSIAKVVAMPITAGIIVGLVLGPLVDLMVRYKVPQHLAAALLVLAAVTLGAMAVALLTVPMTAWIDQLPSMVAALKAKLSGVFEVLDRLEKMAGSLAPRASAPEVTVTDGSPLFDIAMSSSAAAGGLILFIGTVYFYLATRRHLKAQILRLCLGREARKSAGAFFAEIEDRVAIYLAMVSVINLAVGGITAGIAWAAGLPYPIFWGALAFVLNYLAFIGPIIVTALLFAAGLLSTSTVLGALWPAALYFVVHLIEGNVVTPVAVGNRLTISPFLVFIAFIFWLWLWGPVGAILSTPLVIIAIVAQETIVAYRAANSEPTVAS